MSKLSQTVVIEPHYAGSILYYAVLLEAEKVIFEMKGRWEKSSYRNRTTILGPNGILNLSIPTKRSGRNESSYDEVEISYEEEWQGHHWKSLCAAYRRSPFFEYYEDKIAFLYEQSSPKLSDFVLHQQKVILNLLQVEIREQFSEAYVEEVNVLDLRNKILPGGADPNIGVDFSFADYIQVFNDRLPFASNLSIWDLLFNLGPSATTYLKSVLK